MFTLTYHHVALHARSAEASFSFYQRLFNYQEVLRHEIAGGGTILHVAQDQGAPILEIIEDHELLRVPERAVHLGFSCSNMKELLDRLHKLEVKIERGPLTVGTETLLFIRDPDGYLIEINDGLE
jgi:catechol 2,3-dioxygenase-like lactoylglutathione lyase family enzyme